MLFHTCMTVLPLGLLVSISFVFGGACFCEFKLKHETFSKAKQYSKDFEKYL